MRAAALPWLVVSLGSIAASAGACGSGFSAAPGSGGSGGADGVGSTSSSGTVVAASSSSTSSGSGTSSHSSSSGGPACAAPAVMCPSSSTCTDLSSNANNCGACGYSCNGQACSNGTCNLFAPGSWVPISDGADLAIDTANVYWTTGVPTTGEVLSVPKTGGPPALVAMGQDQPRGIATDGTHVFWTNGHGGTVMQADVNGMNPITLASSQTNPYGIATDGVNVYWTNDTTPGTVSQMAVGGGPTTVVVTTPLSSPLKITVTATDLFWTSPGAGTVEAATIGGGNHRVVASFQSAPHGITNGAGGIFFTNSTFTAGFGDGGVGNDVVEVTKTGGSATPALNTLATGQNKPWDLATDGVTVYWGDQGDGTINAVPITGGLVVHLATGQTTPEGMAVDTTSVYWIDNGGHMVSRAAK